MSPESVNAVGAMGRTPRSGLYGAVVTNRAASLSTPNDEVRLACALLAESRIQCRGRGRGLHFEVVLQRIWAVCVVRWNLTAPRSAGGQHVRALPALGVVDDPVMEPHRFVLCGRRQLQRQCPAGLVGR